MSDLGKAALWYAQNGIAIFPLRPRSKNPITRHGFQDASADPKQVVEWWREFPQANLGMPTGAVTGRFLFDADFWNKRAPVHSRDELREQYGSWNDTAEVLTGRGGLHLYFAYGGGKLPRQIATGLDLKGDGGYSVLPPSIHPTGTEYAFDGMDGRKTFLRPAAPPVWLLDAIAHGDRPPKRAAAEDQWPAGERNNRLASLAGKLRRSGLTVEAITAALLEENRRRCAPPLAESEVRRIAASIARYAPPENSWLRDASVTMAASAVEATIESLNATLLFHGRIRFTSISRRGSMIIAATEGNQQIIWPTMGDLTSFSKTRAVIAEGADVLLPQPPRNQVAKVWDPIAELIVRLSAADAVRVEHVLKAECKDLLILMWRYAGQPAAQNSKQFMDFMVAISKAVRDREQPAPPCVFVAEECVWVHVPTFRNWLSMPRLTNHLYSLADIRQGLLLLDFAYVKDVTRGADGDSESASLWRGPVDVLAE